MNQKYDKEEIVKKGLELFYERGYNSLGVNEICQSTTMTKGAFYNAFQSKESFLIESIEYYGRNNTLRIEKELSPKTSIKALDTLQNFYIKMMNAQPKVKFAGCFVNNIMSELGSSNEQVADVCDRQFQLFLRAIEPTVGKAQEEGSLTRDYSSMELAELIHSTFYGALTIARCSQNHKQSIKIINLLFQNLKSNNNGKNNYN